MKSLALAKGLLLAALPFIALALTGLIGLLLNPLSAFEAGFSDHRSPR
jgi:hypothetical protein